MNITTRDFIKSAGIAFLSTIITAVITSLNAGQFPTWAELKVALIAGAATLLGALLKFMSTNTVESAKNDIKATMKAGEQVTIKKDI